MITGARYGRRSKRFVGLVRMVVLVTTTRLVLEIARDLRHRKHGFTRAAVQFVRVILYPVLVHLPVDAGQEQQVELGGLHLAHAGQQAVHDGGDARETADYSRLTVS